MSEDIGRILQYINEYIKGWNVHGTAGSCRGAYGVEDVPLSELDLTPGLIGRAHA